MSRIMDDELLKINQEQTGKKYNKLTIIEVIKEQRISKKTGFERTETVAVCLCECGGIRYTSLSSVKHGSCKSCGCSSRTQDGATYTETYYRWIHNKGSKMIDFSEEWNDFAVFKKWCDDNNFSDGDTVLRIDVNQPIGPNNAKIQAAKDVKRKMKHVYHIVAPDGTEYMEDSLYRFCFDNGLNPFMFSRVSSNRSLKRQSDKYEDKLYVHVRHWDWTVDRILRKETVIPPTYEDQFFYPPTLF